MKFWSRSRSKPVNRKLEKVQSTRKAEVAANDSKNASEKTSVLETKLQQRNKISTKDLEDIAQLEQKLKQRDSDLSSAQEEIKKLEDKVQNLGDHIRCSNGEIKQLKTSLQQRDTALSSANNEVTEAKELTWKQRKNWLHTENLLAQAEKDLIRASTENDGKELEMLKISNRVIQR